MKIVTQYLVACATVALFFSVFGGGSATAQDAVDTSVCAEALRGALHAHHAFPEQGRLTRMVYRVRSLLRSSSGVDTIASRVVRVQGDHVTGIQGERFSLWSDDRYSVRVIPESKLIHITDLRRGRKVAAGQSIVNAVFPDTLVALSQITACRELEQGGREISLEIDPGARRFFNARFVTAQINTAGEVVDFLIHHPEGSRAVATDIRVESIDDELDTFGSNGSVLDRFFDSTGRLRSEYTGYRIYGNTSYGGSGNAEFGTRNSE